MDLRKNLLEYQEKLDDIKSKYLEFDPHSILLKNNINNDMIFTNIRDSFVPFNQPCIFFSTFFK